MHSRYHRNVIKNVPISVSFAETPVECVSTFKYLGVHRDHHLSFKHHVTKICSKINARKGLLWRIRHFIPESLKKYLYTAPIDPHLKHFSIVIDGCSLTQKRKLQVSQNNSLRAVKRCEPRFPTDTLYSDLSIEWVDISMAELTCIEIYKCLNGLNPPGVCDMLPSVPHNQCLCSSSSSNLVIFSCVIRSTVEYPHFFNQRSEYHNTLGITEYNEKHIVH